ncbi:hypothetical protein EG328_003072 [Venturia inaequalis]|uniref:Uncharacterized protein n=1 Tax=Venturia inaequalis TaxID=5025 RepID=A0A8H3VHZ9_VENIN|nr:hypothetical protein EG328_003072 [Venturia inaequalis]KAE9993853.1 hypothetical protein EG327_002760 [Venturia inaequalis]RDI84612.1 hypothetical protein Vi05172_g5347 [Venturia inaequalis]
MFTYQTLPIALVTIVLLSGVSSSSSSDGKTDDRNSNNSKQVSRASVLWTLSVLALNSMSQPSGRVCNSPSEIGFYLRSSPLVCLLDAFYIPTRMIWTRYNCQRNGTNTFVKDFLKFRFRDEPLRGTAPVDGSLRSFRKNVVTRWILFGLGALAPAIKIYAWRGQSLIWPKIWASFYLWSFFVGECMVMFPARGNGITVESIHEGDQNSTEGFVAVTGAGSLPYVAIAAGAILNLYILAQVLPIIFPTYPLSPLQWTGCVILVPVAVVAIPSWYYTVRALNYRRADVLESLWQPMLLFLATLAFPSWLIWAFPDLNISSDALVMLVIAGWGWICTNFFARMFQGIVKKGGPVQRRLEEGLSFYFMTLNFTAFTLFFLFMYSPEDTFKPGWAEWLG